MDGFTSNVISLYLFNILLFFYKYFRKWAITLDKSHLGSSAQINVKDIGLAPQSSFLCSLLNLFGFVNVAHGEGNIVTLYRIFTLHFFIVNFIFIHFDTSAHLFKKWRSKPLEWYPSSTNLGTKGAYGSK